MNNNNETYVRVDSFGKFDVADKSVLDVPEEKREAGDRTTKKSLS